MEIKISCPLGHQCETAKDNVVHRCAWYIQVRGKNPQTGIDLDEWGCAMAWTPVLLIENARTNRSTAVAIESFRNEVVKQNDTMIQLTAIDQHSKQKALTNG